MRRLFTVLTLILSAFHLTAQTTRLYAYQDIDDNGELEIGYQDEHGVKYGDIYQIERMPDTYSSGVRRVIRDHLVGFINKKGYIVIKPQFCEAERFAKKNCAVRKGGQLRNDESTDAKGKFYWEGGQWGIINLKGKSVKPFIYERQWNEQHQCFEYSSGNERFILTQKGKIKKL